MESTAVMPSGIVNLFDNGWINGCPQLVNFIKGDRFEYYYHPKNF